LRSKKSLEKMRFFKEVMSSGTELAKQVPCQSSQFF